MYIQFRKEKKIIQLSTEFSNEKIAIHKNILYKYVLQKIQKKSFGFKYKYENMEVYHVYQEVVTAVDCFI